MARMLNQSRARGYIESHKVPDTLYYGNVGTLLPYGAPCGAITMASKKANSKGILR